VVLEFARRCGSRWACSEPFVEPTIKAVLSAARTGEVGDGKIFVQPIERVIRIRTAEQDNAALTAVNADDVQRKAIEEPYQVGPGGQGRGEWALRARRAQLLLL